MKVPPAQLHRKRQSTAVSLIRVFAITVAMTVGVTASAHEITPDEGWKKTGNSKAAGLDRCVEPTEVMRRNHMVMLMHQRDETMHRGIRTTQHSLVNCIDCHANKDDRGQFVPVNQKGQFCQACHGFTGVKMDCFECHATTPRQNARRAGMADAQAK
jgi:[DsrC]-trisulfide reductase subunit J